MRRPFDGWGELVDFLIVLSVCIAGLVSLMWWPAVPIGATALFCSAAGMLIEAAFGAETMTGKAEKIVCGDTLDVGSTRVWLLTGVH